MIRRTVAIVMFLVLLFNMGGYFILYTMLEARAVSLLNARILDGDVDPVEFKVSFEMPYPVYDQRLELETPDRIKADRGIYSLTSHEFSDNTLTIVGVRDQWAMHVDAVLSAFNKAANGDTSDANFVHSLTTLLQVFVADDEISLVQKNFWKQILYPIDYNQYFASIDLPSDPRPPCA